MFSVDINDLSSSPSPELLLSIVRKGSLSLVRKGLCQDAQDNGIIHRLRSVKSREALMSLCRPFIVSPLRRSWRKHLVTGGAGTRSVANGAPGARSVVRVMQWNMLSQSLGTGIDGFNSCSPQTLNWNLRRWRIIHEILVHDPDVVCLQEVDHYRSVS